MTTIGTTSWKVMISTTITTNDGWDNEPAGDILYLLCPKIDFMWELMYKTYPMAGGSSFSDHTGKRVQMVKINNAILMNTDINKVSEIFIMEAHRGIKDPLYIFIKLPEPGSSVGSTESATVYKSFENNLQTIVWHLRGFLQKPKISVSAGHLYKMSLGFVECWM